MQGHVQLREGQERSTLHNIAASSDESDDNVLEENLMTDNDDGADSSDIITKEEVEQASREDTITEQTVVVATSVVATPLAEVRSSLQLENTVSLSDEFDTHDCDPTEAGSSADLVNNGYLTRIEQERLTFASKVTGHPISALASASLSAKNAGTLPFTEQKNGQSVPGGTSTMMTHKEIAARKEYKALFDRFMTYNYLEVRRDLVCRVSTSMEVKRMMGAFQDLALANTSIGQLYKDMLPSPGALSGTCHVRPRTPLRVSASLCFCVSASAL